MPRVLLVDDQPHMRRVAELALRTIGCDVDNADDGEQAWQRLAATRPDLIVTDIQMPRMNGIQLLRKIRSTPEFADLPVILLTAKGFELSAEDAQVTDTCQIISKPFSPAGLARDVRNELQRCASSAD